VNHPSVASIAPAGLRRILVRLPNWLGDTVMALPMLRALGAAAPQAELWCLGPWANPLLEAEPGVSRRMDVPVRGPARRRLLRDLEQAGLDLALLTTNSFGTAFEAWRSGARWRIGFAGDGRSALLTHAVRPAVPSPHQVAAYLGLLAPLGLAPSPVPPRLVVTPARRDQARRLIAELPEGSGPLVGIQLGAAFGPSKLWPAEYFARVADHMTSSRGARVVLLCAPGEERIGEVVRNQARHPLVDTGFNPLDVHTLKGLIARATALLTNDTGPRHIAASYRVPVVCLMGPTSPVYTGTDLEEQVVLREEGLACSPCHLKTCPIDHRCMCRITPDRAIAELERIWGR
jgi:heptosyltransferase-2